IRLHGSFAGPKEAAARRNDKPTGVRRRHKISTLRPWIVAALRQTVRARAEASAPAEPHCLPWETHMPLRKAYLAATALVAVAGFAGLAAAQSSHSHLLNLRLPDGSVEQIRYQGDQVPQIRLETQPMAFAVLSPIADDFAPLAELQQISAAMDREA